MKTSKVLLLTAIVGILVLGPLACYYDQDDERHPTGPDRTGVQGWTINLIVQPATAPANGTATLDVQARFWNLDDQSAVPGQDIYFSIWTIDADDEAVGDQAGPANPYEVSFYDGSITHMATTNGDGVAFIKMYAHYLARGLLEREYFVRAESTIDFDNNAINAWDEHYFRLYNPYYKPGDDDDDEPTETPTPAF